MSRVYAGFLTLLTVSTIGCAASTARGPKGSESAARRERPIPYPVIPPLEYRDALERGTRTSSGEPGPRYWQQSAAYTLRARLIPEDRRLDGSAAIVYENNSPDELRVVFLQLNQNLHEEGARRSVKQEITGGMKLASIRVDGVELSPRAVDGPRYWVDGTRLAIALPDGLASGASTVLDIDFSFVIPQAGADGRMGYSSDNLFFIGYWYPQLAVYDDVVGWQVDEFTGGSEFYAGFASYDMTIEAPVGWVVMATGELLNADEVLASHVRDRLLRAESSDDVVQVLTHEDFGERATAESPDGWLTWHFEAGQVRDVAFSATRESFWDAARTQVGDRDADGRIDYARVDAFYRAIAPRWREMVRYAQHSIDFLSRFTGLSYPWSHMTALEGSEIITGGMEFPMMTLIGDYNARGDSALYYVTAHEFAHMWVPMIVSNDERRFSWMDEGTTTFNENQARKEFFPGFNHDLPDQDTYIERARAGTEGEMMRRSDYHYSGRAFGVASYQKPASVLVALRAILGEEAFLRAYRTYLKRWAYKHPYPWDMFKTFDSVSGRDLDWFWRTWYYETWTLDQAVVSVSGTDDGPRILIEDLGLAPMPVHLRISRADGEVLERRVGVEAWLAGARHITVSIPPGAPVELVEIDPERAFPDVDRSNNTWRRE